MDQSKFQLAQGDAVTWLRALPAASIDLVITDPPYESLEKHRAIGTTTRLKHSKASSNDWFSIFPNARFPELFAEVYRVLKKDSHFYLFCDPETMFVAKPLAEDAGFKFWKPLIWNKCLGPDTLVWTERGVRPIRDVVEGDRVALPEGGSTTVQAVRTTRARSLRLRLSDGSDLVASRDHRFVRGDGVQVEAHTLAVGDSLLTRPVRQRVVDSIAIDDVIPDDDAIYALPRVTSCLWCKQPFENSRAAAAHQARWCESARSKREMANQLGITAKRMRRWMGQGRIPRAWARELDIEQLGERIQCYLQNDLEIWYPRTIPLDYELGKFIGLFAAEGNFTPTGLTFAFHADEKHLHNHIARFARWLGVVTHIYVEGNSAHVNVSFKIAKYLAKHFVGGNDSRDKYFTPAVYAAPSEFRRGIVAGLIEGDGHWANDERRESYVSASPDLAAFAYRELRAAGRCPTFRRFENEHAGGWWIRFDPINRDLPLTIDSVEDIGETDLVDISVTDRDELFLLANGVVSHNCRIGMGYHYRAKYECILFFEKGKRKLNNLGIADVIDAARIVGGYPAEKPPEVSEILVTQSTERGQLVIDPFMGSGSAGVAAIRNGRNFLGNDLCREAIDITRRRLVEEGGHDGFAAAPVDRNEQLGLIL